MEFVLVTLEIPELSESLVTRVKLAGEWLGRGVDNLVCAHIAPLRKCFVADVAFVWSLTSMSTFVGLEVAKLGESLSAQCFFANKWLDTSVCATVDLEVSLLVKRLIAVGDAALVPFPRFTGAHGGA